MEIQYDNSLEVELSNALSSCGQDLALVWLHSLALSRLKPHKKNTILLSLARGRLCQLIAEHLELSSATEFFLTGLYSKLDDLFNDNLSIIVEIFGLSYPRQMAICRHQGIQGLILETIILQEIGDYSQHHTLEIESEQLVQYQQEAAAWADFMHQLITE